MAEQPQKVEVDRQVLLEAQQKGRNATILAYVKLSGPGWLQSAITLGGGSLASSLYLGILGGLAMLWLQPIAMILGVIMLSAISYVTLSTGKRPFRAINTHINPVLGWGWAIATMMANLVWAMPQFSLGTAAVRQNLLPGLFGEGVMPDFAAKLIVCLGFAVICIGMVFSYDSGGRGVKIFNAVLKIMVGAIVLCFFGVVFKMAASEKGLDWGAVFGGFIPDIGLLSRPAETFAPYIAAVDESFRTFWKDLIVQDQRQVMISAFATAVGINMTFLLPYSLLKRGWNRDFRGLAIFDLSTGLFIPFILAISCVVIASASQFHAKPEPTLLGEVKDAQGETVKPAKNIVAGYQKNASARVKHEIGAEAFAKLSPEEHQARIDALPQADKVMASMLVRRDAFDLADSLQPLTGSVFAHYVFGFGVVGMAISSIIILMLINGFVICEVFGRQLTGLPYRLGSILPCLTGMLGPLWLWTGGKAQFWLAVPTSNFGMVLLPIAYLSFFMMMNQRKLLKDDMPAGGRRLWWNLLMGVATGMAGFCSLASLWINLKWTGLLIALGFLVLAILVQVLRKPVALTVEDATQDRP